VTTYEPLIRYINGFATTPLTAVEVELVKRTFVPRKIRKRQYFLQEGEVCEYFGFIVKGAMRQYSVDDKGVEHVVHLSVENWWVGDRESHVMLTPSAYYIDAWEDTDLLVMTRADFLKNLSAITAINEMSRKLDERHAFAIQKRLNASISYPAEKRYAEFVSTYPELVQRFPQHIIASYLGITKETLSRVRRRSVQH
jgi:CRP-like cAMP-binding protein